MEKECKPQDSVQYIKEQWHENGQFASLVVRSGYAKEIYKSVWYPSGKRASLIMCDIKNVEICNLRWDENGNLIKPANM
jgi:antitoxin component YwqK of YwqJK toxin-antitoxin module